MNDGSTVEVGDGFRQIVDHSSGLDLVEGSMLTDEIEQVATLVTKPATTSRK